MSINDQARQIAIVSKQNKPELTSYNHMCVELSNLSEVMQISAVSKVIDEQNAAVYHLYENKQHVLDFVISDSIRVEAEEVIR